jgi:ubiquinone/menaquinone biosynthesis C-methylase UbiE
MVQRDVIVDRQRIDKARDFIKLINDGAMSQAAGAAAELGIADLLASGPKHVDELAHATACHAPSLHRLLRALVSLDLCAEGKDGAFALTPLGSLLRSDTPHSLRSWTILCNKYLGPLLGKLVHSLRTGQSARGPVGGATGFAELERDDQAALIFNGAMAELTTLIASEVVRRYRFDGMRSIVDVGGGYGALLAAVLEAQPGARGALLDLPHAIEGARKHLAASGLDQRCEFIAGDFFESVPAGADAYLLKAVLHDWDDERSVLILRNCRRAIPREGKLLVIERVVPERFEACWLHHAIARMDLTMLVGFAGRERTETEFRQLLASSGFELTKVTATSLDYAVIEAVPC